MTQETPVEPKKLNEAIDRVLDSMTQVKPESDEFAKMVEQLSMLYRIKEIDVNFKLKIIDSKQKQIDGENARTRQRDEYALKVRESEENATFRKDEFDLKMREVTTSIALKELEIEAKEKTLKNLYGISPDTLAIIAANLAGIGLILSYERFNIVTSKAIGFIQKLR